MKSYIWRLTAILLFFRVGVASPSDWPQLQGPDRNSSSSEQGLLQEWPSEGPPLARKISGLGGGDGAPSIAAGRIFGMGNRGNEEVVWALSEDDGKPLWTTPLGPAVEQDARQSQEGPGCTPTVDGDRLYVLGMGGRLACLQAADGKLVWQRSLTKDFGGKVPRWSYRESPLIDGDHIICTPGSAEAMLVALNKLTGEVVWQCKAPDSGEQDAAKATGRGRGRGPSSAAAYSSAIAIDAIGQRQYVQLTATSLVGVGAADGKVLWEYDNAANSNGISCTTPIFHEGMVFATSAYGAGGGLVKLTKSGDDVKAEEVWFSKRMQNHHGGVVAVDGCLYGANGGNGGGNLICLDFNTGDVLWDLRGNRQVAKGSIAFADGRLYYRTEEGVLLLIEPSREKYLERGRFAQPNRSQSPAWSHPVIANGTLYVRDQDAMYCYNVKRTER